MKNQTSNQSGDQNREGIASQPGTPFSPAGEPVILDTSDSIPPQSPIFQATASYRGTDEETAIRTIEMFADKLITLGIAEWRSITLQDGRKGFALFFDRDLWDQSDKKSLVRKEAKNEKKGNNILDATRR